VFLRFDPDHRSATAIRRANAEWAHDLLRGGDRGEHGRHAAPRDRLTFRRIEGWEDA
jgi:nicotinate-nucleotide adenylyltransferase